MALILTLGSLLSLIVVLIGGSMYLYQHGQETLQSQLLQSTQALPTHVLSLWHAVPALGPLGIIELGLFILVLTQIIRVALLAWFYSRIQDYQFTAISLFVLFMLFYSLFSTR